MVQHSYGAVHDRVDDRDLRFSRVAATLGLGALPAAVDLRPGCPPIRDQGQLGSCTGFAITGMREYLARHKDPVVKSLSPLWLYFEERKREHMIQQDGGAQIRDGFRVLAGMGCAPESDWPYDATKVFAVPPHQALADAAPMKIVAYHRLNAPIEIKQALTLDRPVVIGVEVFESFESADAAATGVIPVPDPNAENFLGGHAICLVGYNDARAQFCFRNSWGLGWGDGGYGYLPYGYFDPNLQLIADMWTGHA